VAFVWEKLDLKTEKKLRKRIKGHGISYDRIARDNGRVYFSLCGGQSRYRKEAHGRHRGE
jgi:hypothetical protein